VASLLPSFPKKQIKSKSDDTWQSYMLVLDFWFRILFGSQKLYLKGTRSPGLLDGIPNCQWFAYTM
jgi:hypothetical protein